ncbi:MAG TPA: hypothetical protein EYN67_06335 [Flavobacteriales bacterium]|nr:hypothetical protein [Flavobacteriales bacterium]
METADVLAYQRVFPNCYTYYGLIPSHWTGFDPAALVEGLTFLAELNPTKQKKFSAMQLLLPHFCASDYATFRRYCGTTPLGQTPQSWKNYNDLVQKTIQMGYNVHIIDCYTSKNIELEEKYYNPLFKEVDIFAEENEYVRFMTDKPIFGTVKFDSESVIGSRYKWGLENKLSTQALPIAYMLGHKEIYVAGFDLVGSRFYDDNVRHPWDEGKTISGPPPFIGPWDDDLMDQRNMHHIPLEFIKKWADWEPLHGMKIYSVVEDQYTLVNNVLDYKPFEEAILERKKQ